MKKKKRVIKKFKKYFNIVAMIVLVTATIIVFVSTLNLSGGLKLYNVMSGSMAPTIKTGGLIIVSQNDDYRTGDIITFAHGDSINLTTHRIVGKTENGGVVQYQTKGDANDSNDPEAITKDRIYGKVLYAFPYLGYLSSFAKSKLGLITLVFIPATLIILGEIIKIFRKLNNVILKKKAFE